jgi:ABC-type sugar transport system substrate-binding protein
MEGFTMKKVKVLSILLISFLVIISSSAVFAKNADGQYKIGIMPFSTGNDWFNPFTAGGKWFLEAKGCEVLVQNAEWDSKKMNTILSVWAGDPEVDAVIVAPVGAEQVLPGIRTLEKAGKVVVLTNNEAGKCPEAIFSVSYDSQMGPAESAVKIVQMIIDKNGAPKGAIILGLGDVRNSEHILRAEAFRSVFKKYPDIQIHEFISDMDAGLAVTRCGQLLRTLPDVDAIVSVGMLEFMGMINALKRENMAIPKGQEGHIICVGIDSAPQIINPAIKEGIVDWAIDQPVLAYNAIAGYYLLKYLENGKDALPQSGTIINPADLDIKTKVPVAGVDAVVPSDSWAPIEVVDKTEESGHIWLKTNYTIVDDTNVDDPSIWSNIIKGIKDWGF